jgi:hypothetical protein
MFKIQNIQNGVHATLSGFKPQEIKAQIEACQSGDCECACDTETMSKITSVEVSGEGEHTEITVEGDVKAEEISEMMRECLIGKQDA